MFSVYLTEKAIKRFLIQEEELMNDKYRKGAPCMDAPFLYIDVKELVISSSPQLIC